MVRKKELDFLLLAALGVVLGALAAWTCIAARQWPMRGDCTLMHYMVFLLESGWRPYVGFHDVNLPGAYLVDWLVIHLLGSGAVAERIFDFVACATGTAAMVYLSPRRLRFAGWFAGMMFLLAHLRDGAMHTGQRDLSIAVLLLFAFALSFAALRQRRRWLHLPAGAMLGLACTIKPIAILFVLPLLIGTCSACWVSVAMLGIGTAVPIAVAGLWLVHEGALRTFLTTTIPMIAYHTTLDHLPLHALITRGVAPVGVLLAVGAVLAASMWRSERSVEWNMLLGAVAAGAVYYLMQGKGYAYQRYPFLAFALLLLGWILVSAMQQSGWRRYVGLAGLVAGCLVIAPLSARRAMQYKPSEDQFRVMLEQDLHRLGGASLDGRVQCIDTFSGCIRVLNRMHLQQSTGTLYDEFLFSPEDKPIIRKSRDAFMEELASHPPDVMVVTPQYYATVADDYGKVETWPEFSSYLASHYDLRVQRRPAEKEWIEGMPRTPEGYRLYVRRGTELGQVSAHGAEVE